MLRLVILGSFGYQVIHWTINELLDYCEWVVRMNIEQAVLLIAGYGRRMGNLTESAPKCLLKIGNLSFLERSLNILSKHDIKKIVLVVGYRAEQVQDVIGDRYEGMGIKYIINPRYAETNTAYSLWLARDYLLSVSLILEGDIIFEEQILAHILSCSEGKSVWATVPVTSQRGEGILLSRNETGYVSGVKLVRNPRNRSNEFQFKCAGIQLLTASIAQTFALKLDETIRKGEVQKYADLVLGEILENHSMVLCSLAGMRWAEVDNPNDYQSAQQLFSS